MAFSPRLKILLLNALGLPELVEELESNILEVVTAEIADGAVTQDKLDDDSVGTDQIIANAVGNTELRQSSGLSLIGRSANSTGNVADITAGSDHQVLRRSGTTIGFGTVATNGLANNAVSDEKFRQSGALTVVGNATNSTANVADIAAGSDGQVLRRSGTSLGFGTVATDGLADSSVTSAKLDQNLIKFADVTIAHADLLTLGTVPVELVPAPSSGFTIDFISAYAFYNYDTAAYTLAAETIDIEYGDGSTVLASILSNAEFVGSADVRKNMRAAVANLAPVDASKLQLTTSGNTDPSDGNANASLKVRVYYRIIPYSL